MSNVQVVKRTEHAVEQLMLPVTPNDIYPVCYDPAKTGQKVAEYITVIQDIMEREKIDKFSLAFQGTSGAVIAYAIWQVLHSHIISMIHVRKEKEPCHSLAGNCSYRYKRKDIKSEPVLIVDDFMASGRTVEEIYSMLENERFDNILGIIANNSGSHSLSYPDVKYFLIDYQTAEFL